MFENFLDVRFLEIEHFNITLGKCKNNYQKRPNKNHNFLPEFEPDSWILPLFHQILPHFATFEQFLISIWPFLSYQN